MTATNTNFASSVDNDMMGHEGKKQFKDHNLPLDTNEKFNLTIVS